MPSPFSKPPPVGEPTSPLDTCHSKTTMSESEDSSEQSAKSLSGELFDFCQSDSLSEKGLREIIERRHGFTPNDKLELTPNYNDELHRNSLHIACLNERVTEGIIRCLLEYFPAAATVATDIQGYTPLHFACFNPNVTLNIIQLIIKAAPDSVRIKDKYGWTPLHALCAIRMVDKATEIQILKLLIEKCPEAARHADTMYVPGRLPIHLAAETKSPEFCSLLIEAYPGSERISCFSDGHLPLHCACARNTVDVVEYLCKLYPEAIHRATPNGSYPIHSAIDYKNGLAALNSMQFLLDYDPNVKLQKHRGRCLLLYACVKNYSKTIKIEAVLEVIKLLFDAHPEDIEDNAITSNIQHYQQEVQTFINSQLIYARQAKDRRLLMTPDDKGQLPLHAALQNNATLGSIKLLVKGNPDAVRSSDNNGTLPLHMACEHCDSTAVIQYLLVGLDATTLNAVDKKGETALHYACRGANYDAIGLLIEKYAAVSVSKQNAYKKLPIELLWESNAVEDRESLGYAESIFRLLKSYPEMFMTSSMKQPEPILTQPRLKGRESFVTRMKRRLKARVDRLCEFFLQRKL